MQKPIEIAIETFAKVSQETEKSFGNLTTYQLNLKPTPGRWSIAQCLHHLIVSNETYYIPLQIIIDGKHRNSFFQSIGFISRFFGSYLIKETGPVTSKPMKNPPVFAPSGSDLPGTIVTDFLKHQQQLSALVLQLDKTDLNNTIISSPALGIITYSLKDMLTILAGHEMRHLAQAKRILLNENFKSNH